MHREIYVPPMQPGDVPAPSREIYAHMGEAGIFAMMADFYAELARSDIRHLFPAQDMLRASQKSALFFIGLLGGPPLYLQAHGNPMMRARHMQFQIDEGARNMWLACFETILAQAVARYNFPAQHLDGFRAFLNGFSMWMVNTKSSATQEK